MGIQYMGVHGAREYLDQFAVDYGFGSRVT